MLHTIVRRVCVVNRIFMGNKESQNKILSLSGRGKKSIKDDLSIIDQSITGEGEDPGKMYEEDSEEEVENVESDIVGNDEETSNAFAGAVNLDEWDIWHLSDRFNRKTTEKLFNDLNRDVEEESEGFGVEKEKLVSKYVEELIVPGEEATKKMISLQFGHLGEAFKFEEYEKMKNPENAKYFLEKSNQQKYLEEMEENNEQFLKLVEIAGKNQNKSFMIEIPATRNYVTSFSSNIGEGPTVENVIEGLETMRKMLVKCNVEEMYTNDELKRCIDVLSLNNPKESIERNELLKELEPALMSVHNALESRWKQEGKEYVFEKVEFDMAI